MRRWAPALLLALAACGGEPQPEPSPTPAPVPTPSLSPAPRIAATSATGSADLPAPELDGRAIAAGGWTRRDDKGAAALFGSPDGAVRFSVGCDAAAHRLVLSRAGAGGGRVMRLVTPTGATSLPAAAVAGKPGVEARVPATDSFFTGLMRRMPDRIGVRLDEGETLVVPGDPALAAVIRACQPG